MQIASAHTTYIIGSILEHFTFRFTVLFLLRIIFVRAVAERICVPAESPEMPPRLYPLADHRREFVKILNASAIKNQMRLHIAQSQPPGENAKYVSEVLLGVQVEALGAENFAQVLPAMDLALESIQNSSAFSGVTFTIVPILHLTSIPCDTLALLEQLNKNGIHVLFGPLNDFTIANAARFSTSMYNIPLVTPGGFAYQLSDKVEYALLTRVFFSYSDLAWLFEVTMKAYGWLPNQQTPVGVYALRNQRRRDSDTGHTALVGVFQQQTIQKFLTEGNYKVFQIQTDDQSAVVEQFLKRLPDTARVIILCADPAAVRFIMLKAHEMGYTNGAYVFFNVDLFSTRDQLERPWYRKESSKEENEKARKAYRALMTISLKKPDSPEYKRFSAQVRARSLRDYQGKFPDSEVRMFIGLFHDAVMLYSIALNDALSHGIGISDGRKMTHLMWNRTFQGVTGTIRIDSNGDRNADYSLLDMDPETGLFKIVANYFGNDKTMRPIPGVNIDWVNSANKPPPAIPECGFDGSQCHSDYILMISVICAILFGVILTVAIILAVVLYRRAELQALNWIIDWSELKFPDRYESLHDAHAGIDESGDKNDSPPVPVDAAEGVLGRYVQPFGEVNTVDTAGEGGGGGSPQRARKKSWLNKGLTYNGSNDKQRKGAIKFAEEPAKCQMVSTDEGVEVPEEFIKQPAVLKRFQQRWARRSRAVEEVTLVTQSSAPMGHKSLSKAHSEAVYIKSPSFDYSSVTSRHRNLAARRKQEGSGSEPEYNPLLEPIHMTRRKKDSQISRHSAETQASLIREQLARSQRFGATATYKGSVVFVKAIRRQSRIEANKETSMEVNKVKDMNNDHICRLIGICVELPHQYIVTEYCPRGSLQDFLRKEQFTMEWMFKLSLIQDICRGMTYLHQIYGPHGNLKSSNCLLDSRFAVKLTDFGIPRIRGPRPQKSEMDPRAYYEGLLWTAPELMPVDDNEPAKPGTFKGDVYSFAIICQELIYRKGVFYMGNDDPPELEEIVKAVKQCRRPILRPILEPHEECTDEIVQLIKKAWDDDPVQRPDFRAIGKNIIADAPGNLVDNLLDRMQHYTNDLEAMVIKRTEQYKDEKKRAEDLLYSMLPQSVASQLINKHTVEAESFEKVTIYFSDIVGFTSLSAESTPMQVVELLNQLYTLFDDIIGNFDVYKVETIGDAYMVASGLPKRNGNEHARAVARMSIAFLKELFEFQIPHRPEKRLELRIGIHSGPVCAGVVGQKMPRYCLFGDTVNTSSRMESNGLPLKIHISKETFKVLQTFNSFIMTERGLVKMKGKGEQNTYWLHGEGSFVVDPVPAGAILVGGPYDGAVGPIEAGVIPKIVSRPQLPRSRHISASPSSPTPIVAMDTSCPPDYDEAQLSSNCEPSGDKNKRRLGVFQPNGLQVSSANIMPNAAVTNTSADAVKGQSYKVTV
ncbi:unnamed protein product [Calicophoron daubneyi]|uniref:Guanylate cyclase n=1 Tax=Calicophoron daubneyi TaxID=300641 RepID=A0AAV2TVK8_CALDB